MTTFRRPVGNLDERLEMRRRRLSIFASEFSLCRCSRTPCEIMNESHARRARGLLLK
jgi:hypothetical protein